MPRIIDVVDHVNVMDDELVYREPQGGSGDFRFGSQVIVQESQAAVFVRQGQVLDALGPGSHTLSTGNLPILSGLIGLATSGRTPFTADLYFVNLKDLPQVPWGTNPPIVMETPGRGVGVVLLITHGVIDIGIEEPVRFVKQYAIGKPILRLATSATASSRCCSAAGAVDFVVGRAEHHGCEPPAGQPKARHGALERAVRADRHADQAFEQALHRRKLRPKNCGTTSISRPTSGSAT